MFLFFEYKKSFNEKNILRCGENFSAPSKGKSNGQSTDSDRNAV